MYVILSYVLQKRIQHCHFCPLAETEVWEVDRDDVLFYFLTQFWANPHWFLKNDIVSKFRHLEQMFCIIPNINHIKMDFSTLLRNWMVFKGLLCFSHKMYNCKHKKVCMMTEYPAGITLTFHMNNNDILPKPEWLNCWWAVDRFENNTQNKGIVMKSVKERGGGAQNSNKNKQMMQKLTYTQEVTMRGLM